jgi:hypothetical protein
MAKLKAHPKRRTGWNRAGFGWLAIVTVALWVTGIGLYLWPADSAIDLPIWEERVRRLSIASHGVLAWLFLLLAGRWIWPHVSLVWRKRNPAAKRLLGMLTLFAAGIAALAGLGLLYGSATWRDYLAGVHWWIALFWPLLCGAHIGWHWMEDRKA